MTIAEQVHDMKDVWNMICRMKREIEYASVLEELVNVVANLPRQGDEFYRYKQRLHSAVYISDDKDIYPTPWLFTLNICLKSMGMTIDIQRPLWKACRERNFNGGRYRLMEGTIVGIVVDPIYGDQLPMITKSLMAYDSENADLTVHQSGGVMSVQNNRQTTEPLFYSTFPYV